MCVCECVCVCVSVHACVTESCTVSSILQDFSLKNKERFSTTVMSIIIIITFTCTNILVHVHISNVHV